jgi:hypothetical protein
MAGSVNDFQKEKQFRKLNAKKEDRDVKVRIVDFSRCSVLQSKCLGAKMWLSLLGQQIRSAMHDLN